LERALQGGWIAPLGPEVDAFEAEFAATMGGSHTCLAVNSGTAALHLALRVAGVTEGAAVLVSALTFCASVNPILYLGARPVLVDCEASTWNLDPNLVERHLSDLSRRGERLPRAMIAVHLYGQPCDLSALRSLSHRFGVPLIEDAAEGLGGQWQGKPLGSVGDLGIFSFNGNKLITTSGGGMLTSTNQDHIKRARSLSQQAKQPGYDHYHHIEMGYNYRLSNLLAAVGRVQLRSLTSRVLKRRALFAAYESALGVVPGVLMTPELSAGKHARWLSTLSFESGFPASPGDVVQKLESEGIEARRTWKPMHLQPLYSDFLLLGSGEVSRAVFDRGLCLPSGCDVDDQVIQLIADSLRGLA